MSNKYPKITVITPSYNQGNFIEETILSVLNQNYPNLEYIIIDGGSTDNSVEIIKKYSDRLAYWVSEADEGQTHAINKGIGLATGEYINWLNSDDILAANSLFKISEFFNNNSDADVVFGKSNLINVDGQIIKLRTTIKYSSLQLWSFTTSLCQPSVFFKRSLLVITGALDASLNWVMDQDLYLRFEMNKSVFKAAKFTISYFRAHQESKSSYGREEFYKQLHFLSTTKYLNPIPHYLRKFLWYYYRSKRYILNIPTLIKFRILSLQHGSFSYLDYDKIIVNKER